MDNNVITLPTIKDPDDLLETASDDLSEYIIKYADAGVPLVSLIGLLDIFKTSLTIELLDDSVE